MPASRTSESARPLRKKSRPRLNEARSVKRRLVKLKPFIEQVRRSSLDADSILTNCIRASFVKAYEFSQFAHGRLCDEFAFHCVGGLRSICEDLIILKFVSKMPPEDQKTLLLGNMIRSVDASIRRQTPFFATFRLGQPVLNRSYEPSALARLDDDLISFWRGSGWPRKSTADWPQTRQIAEKVGPGILDVMYNYIYRLTSGVVHFNTGALLRTGWGANKDSCEFSTANMGAYYSAFCRTYGVFLLTIYFEFFGFDLGMDDVVAECVKQLRRSLVMQNRWPEMITFEEMNVPVPAGNPFAIIFQKVLAAEIEDGFITSIEKMKGAERTRAGS